MDVFSEFFGIFPWYYFPLLGGLTFFLSCIVFRYVWRRRDTKKTKLAATMVVLGSGGHTREMEKILRHMPPDYFTPRLYIFAKTDVTSWKKISIFEEGRGRDDFKRYAIVRAREVGERYSSAIKKIITATIQSFHLIRDLNPSLILCNGPGTCVPVCLAAGLMRLLGLTDAKIIYVESICRVKSLSLSAILLSPIVDKIFVQWESLIENHPLRWKMVYVDKISSF